MTKKNNIFLIGPMGAGKSSVGKYLAQQLKKDFYDSDEEIENRTGVDIGWIFDVEGETGFRQRETEVIDEVTKLSNIVFATGGGSILAPENQAFLAERGTIIYLRVSLDLQPLRTINELRRPLLRGSNRQEVLEQLYEERRPLYEKLAEFSVTTDNRTVHSVTEEILNFLRIP